MAVLYLIFEPVGKKNAFLPEKLLFQKSLLTELETILTE